MDILSHTLTGVAVSTTLLPFSNKKVSSKLAIIFAGGVGGCLPDFDVISLWSGFDASFGRFFNLANSGKDIYYGQLWYSHHGFLHSIFAGLILSVLLFGIVSVIRKKKILRTSFRDTRTLIGIAFFFGFIFHLLQDMPTPYCVWGGVRFFWPVKEYIGGTGSIWWWNNYNLFLIIIAVIALNLIVVVFLRKSLKIVRYVPVIIFMLGFSISIIQIKNRSVDFNYKGFSPSFEEFEKKSLKVQKEILGSKTYNLMRRLDNKIPLNF